MVECKRDRRETGLESPWFILQAPTTKSVGCLHQPEAGRRWLGQSVTVWFPRRRPCLSGLGLCATCAGRMTGTSEADSAGRGRAQACPAPGQISRVSIVGPYVQRNRGQHAVCPTAAVFRQLLRLTVAPLFRFQAANRSEIDHQPCALPASFALLGILDPMFHVDCGFQFLRGRVDNALDPARVFPKTGILRPGMTSARCPAGFEVLAMQVAFG